MKNKVRCLLYSAGLEITFWGDALLHAVWLYNRTYHKGVDKTPYQAWTGKIPCLDGLLTFGAKITSKKARSRRNAGDANIYHGIFLGYRATMENIVYWDLHSHSKRTAKHNKIFSSRATVIRVAEEFLPQFSPCCTTTEVEFCVLSRLGALSCFCMLACRVQAESRWMELQIFGCPPLLVFNDAFSTGVGVQQISPTRPRKVH